MKKWIVFIILLLHNILYAQIEQVKKSSSEVDVNEYVAVEKEPKPLNLEEIKAKIGYPEDAYAIGIQGKVIVRILVDEQGKPQKHVMIRSPHPSLTHAVEKEIYNIQFQPGILESTQKPVPIWVNIPFNFLWKEKRIE